MPRTPRNIDTPCKAPYWAWRFAMQVNAQRECIAAAQLDRARMREATARGHHNTAALLEASYAARIGLVRRAAFEKRRLWAMYQIALRNDAAGFKAPEGPYDGKIARMP